MASGREPSGHYLLRRYYCQWAVPEEAALLFSILSSAWAQVEDYGSRYSCRQPQSDWCITEKKIPQEKQKEKFIFAAENNDEQLEWIAGISLKCFLGVLIAVADIRGHVRWSSFMLEEIDPRLTGKGLTDFPAGMIKRVQRAAFVLKQNFRWSFS